MVVLVVVIEVYYAIKDTYFWGAYSKTTLPNVDRNFCTFQRKRRPKMLFYRIYDKTFFLLTNMFDRREIVSTCRGIMILLEGSSVSSEID